MKTEFIFYAKNDITDSQKILFYKRVDETNEETSSEIRKKLSSRRAKILMKLMKIDYLRAFELINLIEKAEINGKKIYIKINEIYIDGTVQKIAGKLFFSENKIAKTFYDDIGKIIELERGDELGS